MRPVILSHRISQQQEHGGSRSIQGNERCARLNADGGTQQGSFCVEKELWGADFVRVLVGFCSIFR